MVNIHETVDAIKTVSVIPFQTFKLHHEIRSQLIPTLDVFPSSRIKHGLKLINYLNFNLRILHFAQNYGFMEIFWQ